VGKQRLEAFTDGVVAIVITIMVLEIKAPAGATFGALKAEIPILLAYVLSFVNVGIFWNNHHHMLHASERINGLALWMNLVLLFWLTLVPLSIRWMDETHFSPVPTASYGIVLIGASIAYVLLERALIRQNGPHSKLARAIGSDRKGNMSLAIYLAAVALSFLRPGVAMALYVVVAMIWFIPDRRIESLF